MVDIHSHILYGVDDGACDIAESLAMLRLAAGEGTTEMVATPHGNLSYTYSPELAAKLLANLRTMSGGVPSLHCGCELCLTAENLEAALATPSQYTIDGRGFLLLEIPGGLPAETATRSVNALLRADIRPIIAHPERTPLLQDRPAVIESWVKAGCLMQITASSVSGAFGRRAADSANTLLKRGLAHIAASDAHDCNRRPPLPGGIRENFTRKYGSRCADLLLEENPRAVLFGGSEILLPGARKRDWIFS